MNINSENAQKYIIIATVVLLGSTISAIINPPPNVKKPQRPTRTIVGGILAMMTCSVVAEADPKLGVTLATAVSGGAFIIYGLPRINLYFAQEGKKAK